MEIEKPKTEKLVLIIKESTLQSWLHDAGTFAMCVALISLGVFLQSNAMQWVGAIVFLIWLVTSSARNRVYKTVAEARACLDRFERGENS